MTMVYIPRLIFFNYLHVDCSFEKQFQGEFLYDLQLPVSFVPNNSDKEMEQFYLWTVPEVCIYLSCKQLIVFNVFLINRQLKEAIIRDDFKPNCAVAVLDFLIRHGFITPEQGKYSSVCFFTFFKVNLFVFLFICLSRN